MKEEKTTSEEEAGQLFKQGHSKCKGTETKKRVV